MNNAIERTLAPRLRLGIALQVGEDDCVVVIDGKPGAVRYAKQFPTPHLERVSPGHLVAVATAGDATEVIIWRWYDAVVLGEDGAGIRLWEPAHGEVLARPRPSYRSSPAGSRAYLSSGLPGADWWVAGPAVVTPEDADVELDAVEHLYTVHGLWDDLT